MNNLEPEENEEKNIEEIDDAKEEKEDKSDSKDNSNQNTNTESIPYYSRFNHKSKTTRQNPNYYNMAKSIKSSSSKRPVLSTVPGKRSEACMRT